MNNYHIVAAIVLTMLTASCDKTASKNTSTVASSEWKFGQPQKVNFTADHMHFTGSDNILTLTNLEVMEVYGKFGTEHWRAANETNYVFTARGIYSLSSRALPHNAQIRFSNEPGWLQAQPDKRADIFDIPDGVLSGSFEVSIRLEKPISWEFFNWEGQQVTFLPKKDDSKVGDVLNIKIKKD